MAKKSGGTAVRAATKGIRAGQKSQMGRSAREKDLKWRALDYIREHIFSGEFPPGTRISALGIAKRLSSETGETWSRSPVREAMEILGNEGLIEWQGIAGAEVRTIDKKGLGDSLVLRFAIEAQVAQRLAIEHDPAKIQAIKDCLAQMKELNDRIGKPGKPASAPDWDNLRWEYYALDKSFHLLLAELSGIQRADAFIANQMDHFLLYATQNTSSPSEVYTEHANIVNAIDEYKPKPHESSVMKLRKAIKEHMLGIARRWAFGIDLSLAKEMV